jgi:hypothetical protein
MIRSFASPDTEDLDPLSRRDPTTEGKPPALGNAVRSAAVSGWGEGLSFRIETSLAFDQCRSKSSRRAAIPLTLPSPPTAGERGVSALCFVWRDGDAFAVEILDYH